MIVNELIPLEELGRPRIDVVMTLSGIFRDLLPLQVKLLAEAALKAKILSYGRTDFELLETMRWNPHTGWFWQDEHLARLAASADYFGVPLDLERVRERLAAAVARFSFDWRRVAG